MWNLLAEASSLPEGYQDPGIGTVALYALLGFIVVFIGIAFLVFVIWLIGTLVHKLSGKPMEKGAAPAAVDAKQAEISPAPAYAAGEEPSEETVAVITAAIMAYYAKEKPGCGFTVKRIRKI